MPALVQATPQARARRHWRAAAAALALFAASLAATAAPVRLHFVTKQFPPYAFVGADGEAAGPMADLLRSVCARAGWACSVSVLPWRRAYQVIEAGGADGIFPFVDTPARHAQYAMSPEVVRGRYVLLARACAPGCDAPAWPPTGTIAAFGPSEASRTLTALLQTLPGAQPHLEPDAEVVVRKLLAGRYGDDGLALVNEAMANWQLSSRGGPGAQALRPVRVVREFSYGYALTRKRGHEVLAQRLADELQAMCRSGETARLFKPYELVAADCPPVEAGLKRAPRHHL
ncbi:substrate-binding periplasmic protein [Roseateles cellulosilyticus]|uniref:Transporter substrate-binding domain-containing protein n=1 Tax=Pelomonas cellulosilytica TaxID=2906762 RepID=A0ABS8XTM6_9BURK|nr:transporter substrate-binding domain-containing protein [Pelomonas sp. P8]MCE4553956.1 transporter substrate-binding domain-containing protein [Pelomonas sp. P8]